MKPEAKPQEALYDSSPAPRRHANTVNIDGEEIEVDPLEGEGEDSDTSLV